MATWRYGISNYNFLKFLDFEIGNVYNVHHYNTIHQSFYCVPIKYKAIHAMIPIIIIDHNLAN